MAEEKNVKHVEDEKHVFSEFDVENHDADYEEVELHNGIEESEDVHDFSHDDGVELDELHHMGDDVETSSEEVDVNGKVFSALEVEVDEDEAAEEVEVGQGTEEVSSAVVEAILSEEAVAELDEEELAVAGQASEQHDDYEMNEEPVEEAVVTGGMFTKVEDPKVALKGVDSESSEEQHSEYVADEEIVRIDEE